MKLWRRLLGQSEQEEPRSLAGRSIPAAIPEARARAITLKPEITTVDTGGGITIRVGLRVVDNGNYRRSIPAAKAEDVWLPPGQEKTINGVTVKGGGVYFGSGLQAASGWMEEPALIDPSLSIGHGQGTAGTPDVGYWWTYRRLDPSSRADYLEWLSGDRTDQPASISHAFIYFYGLERRALVDATTSTQAREDIPWVAREVRRLQHQYADDHSFSIYSSSFLSMLECLLATGNELPGDAPTDLKRTWMVPAFVQLGLGRFVAAGMPIPSDWAFVWASVHPNIYSRTPAHRCASEFGQLFRLRYERRFGAGMKIKTKRTTSTIIYRAASPGIGQIDSPVDVPDITTLKSPISALQEIVYQCTDELDAYSRWLGRHADEVGSLAGLALLPPDLLSDVSNAALDEFTSYLSSTLADRSETVVEGVSLIMRWPTQHAGKLTKSEAVAMADLMSVKGFGLEPDARFGGPILGQTTAVLFRVDQANGRPNESWNTAAGLVRVATAVAGASSHSGDALAAAARQILRSLGLSTDLMQRVHACIRWSSLVPPALAIGKPAVKGVDESTRDRLAEFLVDLATGSGDLGPNAMSALTVAYKALGLPADVMYARVHQRSTRPALEPIEVRSPTPRAAGELVPARPPSPPLGALTLDREAIRATIVASAAASALLEEIFDDEETILAPAGPGAADSLTSVNERYGPLLNELKLKSRLSRAAFGEMTARFGLLPNGAIEALNDAALEGCGDVLISEGTDIEVNLTVLAELMAS